MLLSVMEGRGALLGVTEGRVDTPRGERRRCGAGDCIEWRNAENPNILHVKVGINGEFPVGIC